MADQLQPAAAGAPAAVAGADADGGGGIMHTIGRALRMMVMYSLASYAIRTFMGGSGPSSSAPPSSDFAGDGGGGLLTTPHANIWPASTPFSVAFAVSEDHALRRQRPERILAEWNISETLTYDWAKNDALSHNLTVSLPESVTARNASVFGHVQFVPLTPGLPTFSIVTQLNVFRPRPKLSTKVNLLSGEFSDERLETAAKSGESVESVRQQLDQDSTWQSYWRPQLHARLVVDQTAYPPGPLPIQLRRACRIDPATGKYSPPAFVDYFWLLRDRFIPLNATVTEVPLELSFSPISLLKWQLQSQMEASFKQQADFGSTEDDTESLRRMLLEVNPVLLVVTFLVSILHMIFDFLAFKNDIQFWKQDDKSLEGLSIRTVLINSICQLVIFLYLLDNETSWMILLSSGIGVLIEFWKVTKTLDITVVQREGKLPTITFKDKASYIESSTAQYEKEAMRYLSYACYPLAIGYAIYSLIYNQHKGVYSWILGAATSFVYTFGFILMCPQLYLNYRLKSVAHLPWRMLTYKALNTFIDDLFAFVITMPMMHRLACFRDDIIFFIYLYQRWAYRVDYTRTNEFGLKPDDEKEAIAASTKKDDGPDTGGDVVAESSSNLPRDSQLTRRAVSSSQ